jgi:hypothetical protein
MLGHVAPDRVDVEKRVISALTAAVASAGATSVCEQGEFVGTLAVEGEAPPASTGFGSGRRTAAVCGCLADQTRHEIAEPAAAPLGKVPDRTFV